MSDDRLLCTIGGLPYIAAGVVCLMARDIVAVCPLVDRYGATICWWAPLTGYAGAGSIRCADMMARSIYT